MIEAEIFQKKKKPVQDGKSRDGQSNKREDLQ